MNNPPDPEQLARTRAVLLRTINSENPASKLGGRYRKWLDDVEEAKQRLASLDRGEWPWNEDDECPY
jgi:hypothetical protein